VATFTHAQLEQLWIAAGGNPNEADTAAAIAQAESGGCQYAKAGPTDDRPVKECTYRQTTLENSYGLWQINRDAHPDFTAAELYTPAGNAAAAVTIAQAGVDFGPWTTFTDGAYFSYLQNAATTGPQQGAQPLSGSGTGPAASSVQVEQAWARFMRTLAITAPRHLETVAAARSRIRKAVR
jgi:hypothetical protein